MPTLLAGMAFMDHAEGVRYVHPPWLVRQASRKNAAFRWAEPQCPCPGFVATITTADMSFPCVVYSGREWDVLPRADARDYGKGDAMAGEVGKRYAAPGFTEAEHGFLHRYTASLDRVQAMQEGG